MQLTEPQTPHPSELLAEFALGVLSETDAARVRAYIAEDPEAMAEVEEMLRVARLLPFAAHLPVALACAAKMSAHPIRARRSSRSSPSSS